MKKIIITLVVLAAAGVGIAKVLSDNKAENQARIDVVSKVSGVVPVKTFSVHKESIQLDFLANGNFVPNQDLKFMSETAGRITAILVKEGSRVQTGQTLARIEDKYLTLDVQSAKDSYEKIKSDKARFESSLKTGGVTQSQVDDISLQLRNAELRLEQAEKRLGDAVIKAPISGVINKKHIELGAYVSPGTALFDIVDVSSLKLVVAVDEKRVVLLKTGSQVEIKVPVFPDKTFTGTISFIAAKADNSLNFPVEIKVNNAKGEAVKAGMYANAMFRFNQEAPVLAIPRSAFVGSVNSREVYVLQPNNTAAIRKVVPGSVFGETVEILNGLEEGDKVIISGQINLSDGTAVEVVQN
ncbi:efflux RND transporter periplasmic adaptor subunit [Ravibacter arvi]|uniref:Efflux RND transporter periplasmic adaptor subunit n=1 Tax=Ravibacter arvi TaxID=2051041 RepID=A0ABP8LKN8_9BACT